MRTDKQLYHIFRACPEMIFLLAHLPAPRSCKLESISVKALERTMDGLVIPEDSAEPLTVTEIQFQRSSDIYQRVIMEMAQVQLQYGPRLVQGIICFSEGKLDPATEPWKSSGLIRSVCIREELQTIELQTPDHPLVAVLKPIFEPSKATLEKEAAMYYRHLYHNVLSPERREALCDAFVNLLAQRLRHRSPKEIAMILELPDIRDTVCGRELIAEGIEVGKAEGIEVGKAEGLEKGEILRQQKMLRVFATQKFGRLPSRVVTRIRKLSLSQGEELFRRLFDMKKIDDLERWFSEQTAS